MPRDFTVERMRVEALERLAIARKNLLIGADGRDGLDGAPGLNGEPGPRGPAGPMPRHEWDGTKLRFEEPDGTWGPFVDLRGPKGIDGKAGGQRSGLGLDLNGLFQATPEVDAAEPLQIIVQVAGGQWVRVPFSALVTGGGSATSSYADGYADGYA